MVDDICISDVLLAGAKEVFETMIFMDLEEASELGRKIENDAMLGSITFKIDFEGNMQGSLTICCSTPCAKYSCYMRRRDYGQRGCLGRSG